MRNKRGGEVVAWWWLRGGGPQEVHAILVGKMTTRNGRKKYRRGTVELQVGLGQRKRRRWPGGEREEGWAERGESPRGLFYFQNPFLSFENNFVK
jgi:hypothetical protein